MSEKSECPYRSYAGPAFWSKSVAGIDAHDIDPIVTVPFKITKQSKVATAGSCFAQHIARYLQKSGYNYFVAETAPKFVPATIARRYGYGVFSARYANIYTARQLLQLIQRTYGEFQPVEDSWSEGDRFIDPFRPSIQPGGFESLDIYNADREQHYFSIRKMFSECDVFVFTLGLTEAWMHKADGSVYPICPGCGAGSFDPDKYVFYDADYEEILSDLRESISRLRRVNPNIRIILTVSPVPLIATATGEHVLAATTYSKSVLRAVAGKIAKSDQGVAYFPSYEIITGAAARGEYFAPDLRNVTEEGVRHVMGVFFRHFAGETLSEGASTSQSEKVTAQNRPRTAAPRNNSSAEDAAGVFCEEQMLELASR